MPNSLKARTPSITFALLSFNQEKYIREAVTSALSQTYTPMEIILSDDASTDRSYSIINDILKRYRGANKVVARRNSKNLGLEGHLNTVWSIAAGQWIIVAAGDDISAPNRVAEIVAAIKMYPEARLFHSKVITIGLDCSGEAFRKILKETASINPCYVLNDIRDRTNGIAMPVHGATAAYHKDLIELFSPLPKNAVYEDAVLMFRAEMIGKSCFINAPLVGYRISDDQTTNVNTGDFDKNTARIIRNAYGSYLCARQSLQDHSRLIVRLEDRDGRIHKHLRRRVLLERYKYLSVLRPWPLRVLYVILFFMFSRRGQSLSRGLLKRAILPDLLLSRLLKKPSRYNRAYRKPI